MDASQYFGSDLALGATGDLLIADGQEAARQRILRRLLTNPGDYPWQPDYGAGLPAWIGRPMDEPELSGLIRAQMYAEGGVSHDPEPAIGFTAIPRGIAVQIAYTVEDTAERASLSFTVSG